MICDCNSRTVAVSVRDIVAWPAGPRILTLIENESDAGSATN